MASLETKVAALEEKVAALSDTVHDLLLFLKIDKTEDVLSEREEASEILAEAGSSLSTMASNIANITVVPLGVKAPPPPPKSAPPVAVQPEGGRVVWL